MILNCNSCGKKFVVPDQAITANGRLVQCGSCGNKWKQFPTKSEIKKNQPVSSIPKKDTQISKNIKKTKKSKKNKKSAPRKPREINLYSPEYLAKKHGIKLNADVEKIKVDEKVSFGFYNFLILLIVITIALARSLFFFQDFIIQYFPFSEYYLNYLFESIRNMFEIWKNLISNY